MTLKTTSVTLFKSGDDINSGDVFIAKVDHIEGRRRVILVRQKDPVEGTENDLIRKELLVD